MLIIRMHVNDLKNEYGGTRALRALPPRANSDYIGVRPSDFSRKKSNFSRELKYQITNHCFSII